MPPLHFLVPALNEVENLPRLIENLAATTRSLGQPWKLLVVDDGSTDGTSELLLRMADRYPIEVLRHETNQGPGAAFSTGFRHLLSRLDDNAPIITLEADNTSDLGILPRMLRRFGENADVVLASVYHPRGGIQHAPAHRKFLSWGANALVRHRFGLLGYYTLSSFYRIYRVSKLRRVFTLYDDQPMTEPGFAAVVELLIKLHECGALMAEVPMVLDTTQRKGASRMRVRKTVKAYLRMMRRLELREWEY